MFSETRDERAFSSSIPGRTHLNETLSADERISSLTSQLEEYRLWVSKVTKVCAEARNGNLEERLILCDASADLQEMCRAINGFLDITDAFVREAGASLDYAAKGKFFRRVVTRGLNGCFRGAAVIINLATEKMSSNARALINVSKVANSTAALSKSVSEISSRVADSAMVVNMAVKEAAQAASTMRGLNDASKRIGGVLQLISKIARQTNLLALNATIEAARAGDAGRGFAVVAQEVKNLSQQTSKATEEIGSEVVDVQAEATRAASVIGKISETIAELNEGAKAIAHAVSEQKRATDAITDSIQEISGGSLDTSAN